MYYQIIWTALYQLNFSPFCCSLTMYFGICKILVAFCNDFKQTVQHLNGEIKKITRSNKPLPSIERVKLKMMFNDLVRFHTDVRELSVTNLDYQCEKICLNFRFRFHSKKKCFKACWSILTHISSYFCLVDFSRWDILEPEPLWDVHRKCRLWMTTFESLRTVSSYVFSIGKVMQLGTQS